MAYMLFSKVSQTKGRGSLSVSLASAATDNLGNTFAVSKLMSTKFPLTRVVMELAVQLRKMQHQLDLF